MMTPFGSGSLELGPGGHPGSADAVLIAEDDPVFRHALETWLKKWNYRVVAVDNGLEAWNVLQGEDAPPDGHSGLGHARCYARQHRARHEEKLPLRLWKTHDVWKTFAPQWHFGGCGWHLGAIPRQQA
jgi:hypothetical protein